MTTALVVSGGGSKGAFAVGAIEVLREKGIEFDIVAGTSTGSLIAPLVVTDEIHLLRQIYTTVKTGDIIKKRGFFGILFKPESIYKTDPLEKLIEETITEDRFDRIMQSDKQMLLTTVSLPEGRVVYWTNRKPTPEQEADGARMIKDRDTMLRALLASSNQPVLMPTVQVPDGGDAQVDGGVLEVAPLRIAIEGDAAELFAIVLSPKQRERQDKDYDFILPISLRTLDLFIQEITENDLDRAEVYNQAVLYQNEVRQRALDAGLSEAQLAAVFDQGQHKSPFNGKRVLKLTPIRPDHELPTTGLEFEPSVMSEMMEDGRAVAERILSAG